MSQTVDIVGIFTATGYAWILWNVSQMYYTLQNIPIDFPETQTTIMQCH